jgi:hypothetical protein
MIEHGREMQQQDRGGEVTRADEEGRTATLCHLGEEPRGCREGGHQSRPVADAIGDFFSEGRAPFEPG